VEANNGVGVGVYLKQAYMNFTFRLSSLLLGAAMMIWIALVQHSQYRVDADQWSDLTSAIYNAFSRTFFSIGMALFVFPCVFGYFKIINDALGNGLFKILAR